MPPQSRGTPPKSLPVPSGFQSKSTPNLPTLKSDSPSKRDATIGTSSQQSAALSPEVSGDNVTSPSEPASIEDFSLDSAHDLPSLSPASSDEESDGEQEDGHVANLPSHPPIYHQHSRSHTYLGPSAFAPPFYGRPPTPLPPSPSLTSLLRPNFSTHNSRPTTPDPSSDEGGPQGRGHATGTQTPNSAAASTLTSTFRSAKPIPRASPKVPTYEYYGFTLYLTSSLAFIVYLLWSFLPSPFLHQLGIYYYPNRWWALAIPAWTVMLIVYIYVALASYNVGYLTLPLKSVECLVDEAASIAVVDANGNIVRNDKSSWKANDQSKHKHNGSVGKKGGGKARGGGQSRQSSTNTAQIEPELDWKTLWMEGTDAVMDIPIGGVCEILYGGDDEEHEVADEHDGG
ncbi:hypothetical protein CKM354_001094200 [Cercospora kikuchii]|uniref:PIG-P domain-containing protein n=1 Tax=Cercospora kikuchii TaxID=84275 RepID=A0A9P3CR95_9PEZI|nr:phosphatidylinositol N-acetylglucosaminyltransferase GPI19 [Cercospora kikuchii]GIZ47862.1 hypothetical protein CKM354_001094200 [Cercospora kikuchii]